MTIAVIGGGIAGLTTALCLQHFGFKASVFEQADAMTQVGAGLQIGPNAVQVLHALGLEADLLSIGGLPEALCFKSGYSGQDVFCLPLNAPVASKQESAQRWGAPYLHCHRADLIDLLASAVRQRGIDVHLSAQIKKVDAGTIVTAAGDVFEAEFCVFANGIRSRLPGLGLAQASPLYTGSVAWRALIPIALFERHVPTSDAVIWSGRGRHAVTYLLRGETMVNFVGVVDDKAEAAEAWMQQGSQDEALADFRGFHPVVLRALRGAETLYKWGVYEHVLPPAWGNQHAALIGDACHAMPPYLAQGAGMAIEDAWALADCFQAMPDKAAACQAFQALRAPRVQRVMNAACANRKRFHLSSFAERASAFGLLKAADTLLKEKMLKQFDWLYGYDVTTQGNVRLSR